MSSAWNRSFLLSFLSAGPGCAGTSVGRDGRQDSGARQGPRAYLHPWEVPQTQTFGEEAGGCVGRGLLWQPLKCAGSRPVACPLWPPAAPRGLFGWEGNKCWELRGDLSAFPEILLQPPASLRLPEGYPAPRHHIAHASMLQPRNSFSVPRSLSTRPNSKPTCSLPLGPSVCLSALMYIICV